MIRIPRLQRGYLFYILVVGGLMGLIISGFLIYSCSKNGTGSTVSFAPGTYKGTYRVTYAPTTGLEPKVDTMMFTFIRPDTFRMRFSDDDEAHRFCETTRGFYIFGYDSLKIYDVQINTSQQCVWEESPQANYQYLVDHNTIVFKTSMVDDMSRRIDLWVK